MRRKVPISHTKWGLFTLFCTHGFDTSDQGLSRQIEFFGVTWRTDCKYSNISMVRLTHDATKVALAAAIAVPSHRLPK